MPDDAPYADVLADADRHLAAIWASLADAAGARDAPLRTPSLTTAGVDGTPRARTVVLRAADAAGRTLVFHADRRSEKMTELARDPRASCCFWDAAAQVQVRADGVVHVHVDDAFARDEWPRVPASNRINYRTTLAPGTTIPSPDALSHEAGDGADHFAAIVVAVTRLEWLWLDRAGHKRCAFAYDAGGRATRRWLVP